MRTKSASVNRGSLLFIFWKMVSKSILDSRLVLNRFFCILVVLFFLVYQYISRVGSSLLTEYRQAEAYYGLWSRQTTPHARLSIRFAPANKLNRSNLASPVQTVNFPSAFPFKAPLPPHLQNGHPCLSLKARIS
ncbi:hypothetical protein IF2G_06332 [Cordyceps javanica]|nr:hypothetical protein IF2G_06332 [Cordyceps javanica]